MTGIFASALDVAVTGVLAPVFSLPVEIGSKHLGSWWLLMVFNKGAAPLTAFTFEVSPNGTQWCLFSNPYNTLFYGSTDMLVPAGVGRAIVTECPAPYFRCQANTGGAATTLDIWAAHQIQA
jgi:hypothetical protein